MPSLSLCGRQWALASDDLPALALLGALFHGAWLLLLIVFSIIALSLSQPKDCKELAIFMACLLFSTLVSTISDILIIRNGLKGSILQPSSRVYVEIVMYVLTANFLMKIGIIGYGTYLVFIQQPECLKNTSELNKLMQAVIISTWVITLLYICLFIVSYQAFPKNSVLQWKRRIRCVNWCCCGGFDRNESASLARMALVFEQFFNPMDFSATDTLASIILAAKRQSFLRHQCKPDLETLPTYLNTLDDTGALNERLEDRRWEESVRQHIELRQTRLMTVSEDAVMEIMEQGEIVEDPEDIDKGQASSETPPLFPLPFEPEESNLLFDREVQRIGPHHRRTRSLDFREVDLSTLRYEDPNGIIEAQGSDDASHETLSNPDSCGHAESVPSCSPDQFTSRESPPTVEVGAVEVIEDVTDRARSSESRSSVETMLSWGDDFSGPVLIPSSGCMADLSNHCQTVDYNTLERMHLYHRYALASYGALLYLASGKRMMDIFGRFFGLCIHAAPRSSIHSFSLTGNHARTPNGSHRGPSLRQRLNEEAILRYGFRKEDILYRSHEDVLAGHLPYFVALNHEDEAVVVAVRGTWSWSDLVTDFLIYPEPLNDEETTEVNQLLADLRGFDPSRAGCLPNVSVHSGMLTSARALIRNMQNVGMLEFLETGSFQLAASNAEMSLPDMERWKFVMTGHSLGAGVVSLATLLLKSRFPHRKIECFAISPPGCTMSPELATAMSPFCYSLVHGKDIVPRISVRTVERLRDQMVRAATLCRRSKMNVLFSGLFKVKWAEDELFFTPEQVDGEPLDAFRKYRAAVRATNSEDLSIAREFTLPGKIVLLRPTKKKDVSPRSAPKRVFEAVWISGRDLMQEGILLSLFMIKDHFPYFSIESLRDVMDRRGDF